MTKIRRPSSIENNACIRSAEEKMQRDYAMAQANDRMLRDEWQPTEAERAAMRATFGAN